MKPRFYAYTATGPSGCNLIRCEFEDGGVCRTYDYIPGVECREDARTKAELMNARVADDWTPSPDLWALAFEVWLDRPVSGDPVKTWSNRFIEVCKYACGTFVIYNEVSGTTCKVTRNGKEAFNFMREKTTHYAGIERAFR